MIGELMQMYMLYRNKLGIKEAIKNLDNIFIMAYQNHKLHKAMEKLHEV